MRTEMARFNSTRKPLRRKAYQKDLRRRMRTAAGRPGQRADRLPPIERRPRSLLGWVFDGQVIVLQILLLLAVFLTVADITFWRTLLVYAGVID